MLATDKILIYTDGAARGNPGPGGYGVVLMFNNHRKELSAGYRLTTNNRMELLALIEGLKALKKSDLPIHIYSDSQYVVNAITKGWLLKWMKTNFSGGKKNSDLWRLYFRLSRPYNITIHWVKGHANNPYNNRCDTLATEAADGNNLLTDDWYEDNEYKK
jgi:ribonuclease HI